MTPPYSAQSGDRPISGDLGETLACLEVSVGDAHNFREQPDNRPASCLKLILKQNST